MDNEDKRFKQINHIATPIQLDSSGARITPPEEPHIVPKTKKKRSITHNQVLIIFIVILSLANIAALVIFLLPANEGLPYNDVQVTTSIYD